MRATPPHRLGRVTRTVAGVVVVLSTCGTVAACGSVGRTLSKRSLSVVFDDKRTPADVARVRQACDGVGGAKALPPGPDTPVNRRYPLRFDVTGLGVPDRAKLVACLDHDPSVVGFQDTDPTGQ
ncbi:MAG: hypothetical protein WCB04_10555 [Mycobacteriales bacterium]